MTNKPTSMEDFFTADKASEGVRIPLVLPTGEPSPHWLEIHGVDSDEFQLADAEVRATEGSKLAQIRDVREREAARIVMIRKLRARLVKAWSFDEPFSVEGVERLFAKAPQIADAVDRIASDRALFFALASSNSFGTAATSSGSTSAKAMPSSRGGRRTSTSKSRESRSPS